MELKKINVHDDSELTMFLKEEKVEVTEENMALVREHYDELCSLQEEAAPEELTEGLFKRFLRGKQAAPAQQAPAARPAAPAAPVAAPTASTAAPVAPSTSQVASPAGPVQSAATAASASASNNVVKAGNTQGNGSTYTNVSGGVNNVASGNAGAGIVNTVSTTNTQTANNTVASGKGASISAPASTNAVDQSAQMKAPVTDKVAVSSDKVEHKQPQEAPAVSAPVKDETPKDPKGPVSDAAHAKPEKKEEVKKAPAKKAAAPKAETQKDAAYTVDMKDPKAAIGKTPDKATLKASQKEERKEVNLERKEDKLTAKAAKKEESLKAKAENASSPVAKAKAEEKLAKANDKYNTKMDKLDQKAPGQYSTAVGAGSKGASQPKVDTYDASAATSSLSAAKPAASKAAKKPLKEEFEGLSLEEACNVLVRKETYSSNEITSILAESYSSEVGDSISAFMNFTQHIEKTIKICEEVKAKEEKAKAEKEAKVAPVEVAPEETVFGKQLAIGPDGAVSVEAPGTSILITPDKAMQISLAENKQFNRVLKYYLTEDCGMSLQEFVSLTEEAKLTSLKEILSSLLKTIEEKLSSIDTSSADRSRGDIRKFPELNNLQDAITKIEALIERDYNSLPEYSAYIGIVIKAILYLNQYSATFKDAYRNKKTILIMKYQSVVLSIISAVSYFLSVAVNYNERGNIALKKSVDVDLMSFAPYKSLKTFVRSVESGEFKKLVGDSNVLREFYLEHSVETMGAIFESADYIPMIIDGVKNLYSSLTNNGKLIEVIYRAAGVVVLLLSLREVFYTLFKTKTKISDMLSNIGIFAGLNNGGNSLGKLSQFASKFSSDAEFGSEVAKKEIEDENRTVYSKVQNIQAASEIAPVEHHEEPSAGSIVKTSAWDEFDF